MQIDILCFVQQNISTNVPVLASNTSSNLQEGQSASSATRSAASRQTSKKGIIRTKTFIPKPKSDSTSNNKTVVLLQNPETGSDLETGQHSNSAKLDAIPKIKSRQQKRIPDSIRNVADTEEDPFKDDPDLKKGARKKTRTSNSARTSNSTSASDLNLANVSTVPGPSHGYSLRSRTKARVIKRYGVNEGSGEVVALGATSSQHAKREDSEASRLTRTGAVLRRSTRNNKGKHIQLSIPKVSLESLNVNHDEYVLEQGTSFPLFPICS